MDVTGRFVDKPVVHERKHPAETTAVQILQSHCVDIVEDRGQGGRKGGGGAEGTLVEVPLLVAGQHIQLVQTIET